MLIPLPTLFFTPLISLKQSKGDNESGAHMEILTCKAHSLMMQWSNEQMFDTVPEHGVILPPLPNIATAKTINS